LSLDASSVPAERPAPAPESGRLEPELEQESGLALAAVAPAAPLVPLLGFEPMRGVESHPSWAEYSAYAARQPVLGAFPPAPFLARQEELPVAVALELLGSSSNY